MCFVWREERRNKDKLREKLQAGDIEGRREGRIGMGVRNTITVVSLELIILKGALSAALYPNMSEMNRMKRRGGKERRTGEVKKGNERRGQEERIGERVFMFWSGDMGDHASLSACLPACLPASKPDCLSG